eukprot:762481-Hanusia_phi.AAC.1
MFTSLSPPPFHYLPLSLSSSCCHVPPVLPRRLPACLTVSQVWDQQLFARLSTVLQQAEQGSLLALSLKDLGAIVTAYASPEALDLLLLRKLAGLMQQMDPKTFASPDAVQE